MPDTPASPPSRQRLPGHGSWAAGLMLLLAACDSGQGPERPNLILVTVDTTRADAFSCYGNPGVRTPNFDRLAASGVRFAEARTVAPLTLPSHTSLLTGSLPPEHGVRSNGLTALGPEIPTLAEALRGAGRRTAAFVSAVVLDSRYGLDRGFDLYDDIEREESADRRAGDVVDAALSWLEADPDAPFFCWLHFFDPHEPYEPPAGFEDAAHPYLGEVEYVDREFGRLLTWLEQRGLSDSTLVVVTSDHGESMGEHGENTHGAYVYDATLHVPLLMSMPGTLPPRTVVEECVSVIDVDPTVRDLFDLSGPVAGTGRSLTPAFAGQPLAASPAYGESEYCRIHFGWSSVSTLIHQRWKYISSPQPELYDLDQDPREKRDLAAQHPERAAELARALEQLTASLNSHATLSIELDEADARQLESLGYAQGGSSSEGDDTERLNPMQLSNVLRLHSRSLGSMREGRFEEVVTFMQRATESAPGVGLFHDFLGVAYNQLGRTEEAKVELERAVALSPEHPRIHLHLGNTYRNLGDREGAEREYRAARLLGPYLTRARLSLAELLLERESFAEALTELEQLLELDPANIEYRRLLGRAHAAAGAPSKARAELQKAADLARTRGLVPLADEITAEAASLGDGQ